PPQSYCDALRSVPGRSTPEPPTTDARRHEVECRPSSDDRDDARLRDTRGSAPLRSRTFYEQAFEPFGVKVVESSQGPGFAIEGGGAFWIGEGEPPAAPVHVTFAAADRATVDKFHRAA